MNKLTEVIDWLKDVVEKDKVDDHAKLFWKRLIVWLGDLLKYRLMFSELRNEIALSGRKVWTKQALLELLDSEMDDWKLSGKEYDS